MKTLAVAWRHPALVAALLIAASTAHAQSAEHVRSWAASCANCHGTNGQASEGMVKLAGMNQQEMLRQLLDFKNNRRPATVMHQLAKGYSDEQLAAIAAWFATQKP